MIEPTKLRYEANHAWDERYFHKENVTDTTSEPVRVPAETRSLLVTVLPGTDATVEFTNDSYDNIEAGTADWVTSSIDAATSATHAELPPGATAVRFTSTGSSSFVMTTGGVEV